MNQLARAISWVLDFGPALNKFVREHLQKPNHVVYHEFVNNDPQHVAGAHFAAASVSYTM